MIDSRIQLGEFIGSTKGFIKKRPVSSLMILSLFLMVGLHLLLRSILVPVTHDEAFTYLKHVPKSYSVILGLKIEPVEEFANNHVLNTAFIKMLTSVLPPTEPVIRLPNIAAGIIYVFAILMVMGKLFPGHWRFFLYTLLCISYPILLEFFSLARGYGLSVALFAAGYSVWVSNQGITSRHFFPKLSLAVLLFALAIVSNLSVGFGVAGVAVSEAALRLFPGAVLVSRQNPSSPFRSIRNYVSGYFLAIIPGASLLIAVYAKTLPIAFALNLFYVQSREGIFQGTLASLMSGWTDLFPASAQFLLLLLFSVVIIIAISITAIRFGISYARGESVHTAAFQVFVSSLIIVFIPVPIDWLFHTGFPSGRTALYLVPVIGLLVSATVAAQRSGLALDRITDALSIGLILLFVASVNVSHTTYWKYDATSRTEIEFLREYVRTHRESKGGPWRIGCDWVKEPSLNFYLQTLHIGEFETITRSDPLNGEYDFILLGDGFGDRPEGFHPSVREWKELQSWPISGIRLYESQLPRN